jgi:transcriptional regulator with XRE-family HTH domain
MNLKQHVGTKVKAARLKRGLTQERLGELVDKTAESVSNIERGHVLPPLDTLERLARHLDVPMAFFFDDLDRGRSVTRNRLELEHRLRGLGETLSDADLRLAVAMVETIKTERTL